jgi:PAS domain S-box-containing protein
MQIQKSNNIGLTKNRKNLLLLIVFLCLVPFSLSIIGLNFSSDVSSLEHVEYLNQPFVSSVIIQSLSVSINHVFLNFSALILAIVAMIISFIHYREKKDILLPIIGLALIGLGSVDVIHTLAAAEVIPIEFSTNDVLFFTWSISRLFSAATILFVAILSFWLVKKSISFTSKRFQLKLFLLAVLFILIVIFSFVGLMLLSKASIQTMLTYSMFAYLFDALTLVILMCAGGMFWLRYNQEPSFLSFTLTVGTLPLLIAQLHFMFGDNLFDHNFNISLILKLITYGTLLFAMYIDFIQKNRNVYSQTHMNKPLSKGRVFNQSPNNPLDFDKVKWPLSFKIPLAAFLFSLVISLIISSTFYVQSYQLVREKEMSKLSLESKIIKPLFNEFYLQSARDISFLSATPPVQGLIEASNSNDEVLFSLWQKRLNSIFIELLKTKNNYKRMSFISISSTNNVVVSATRLGNKVNSLTTSQLPKNIPLTSLKGMLSGKGEQVYFSDISFDSSTQKTVNQTKAISSFFVGKPIYEPETGTLFGIVAIEVDLLSYIEQLKSKSLNEIDFYIADEHGDFIYYPNEMRSLQKSNNIIKEFPFLEELIRNDKKSKKIYDFSQHNKSKGLGYYSKITFEFNQQVPSLYLFIENQNEVFLLAVQNMRNRFILISLSLAFVSLLVSIFAARKLIKPLASMTRSLSNYEKKGTIGELPTKEQDEIGLLARSFYQLFDTIEHKSFELKHVAIKAESATLKLQAILNSIVDAVITIDKDGKILAFNKSARQMFGYLETEVLNKNIKILMPARFAKHHDRYLKSLLQTGKSKANGGGRELLAVKKNGDIFHMLLTINEVNSEEGIIFTGLIRDITESRQLEVEKKRILLEAKNAAWRLNFALSAPQIGVWDFDLTTKQILWDERMYLLFRVPQDNESTPKCIWQKMVHQEDRENIEQLIKQAAESDDLIHYQHRIVCSNNEVRFIEAHAQVMLDEKGNKVSIVGTYRDNTEQRQLQILKQEALDMAEESLRLKSEFLASMSHEIRTPMNGVLGMLGLLEQSALSKQQAHHLSLAHSSAHSLLALINDILDFSKIEAGKLELEILDFNLRNQFGELAESMAVRAQEKNLELVLDLTEVNESMVKGDPSRLRQILSNLVGNAIKFTNSGEVVIKATIKEQNNQLRLICSISDTGIGIPADKVNQLFDSFTQVDATTTRKYGGTGLGLAIVKQLCDLMGGDVSIESEVNKGCCISFSINLEKSDLSTNVSPASDIKGLEILIVEDNSTNLEVLSKQLEIWGVNTTKAVNGIEALALIEQRSFSMIIINMHMPVMDGVTLGKRISANPKANESQLILMTDMDDNVDGEYFVNSGFVRYFPKPATTTDLFSVLSIASSHSEPNSNAQTTLKNVHLDNEYGLSDSSLPKSARILLVEDNRINQAVILGILANIHLHADVAENGLDAITMLMNSDVDDDYQVIIMDCQMPELDGYETTKMIRKGDIGKRYQSIPIIAMTANAMKGDEDKCFAAGMSDYATKPVDASLLQQKLCQWLGEREPFLIKSDSEANEQPIENSLINNSSLPTEDDTSDEISIEVWQKDEFLKRIRNNAALAESLINLFIEDSPTLIKALINAMEQGSEEDMIHCAHKLKGSARNLSGNKLGLLCEYIENNPRDIKKEQVDLHKQSLENEFELLIHALQNFSD